MFGIRLRSLGFLILLTIILIPNAVAMGEGEYPRRDIRIIVPWSAGGGTDTVSRGLANYAEKHGQGLSFYVENISGASSGVGVNELMMAEPDGYTIGILTWDSVVTVPRIDAVPGYDLEKLDYIATFTAHPISVAVHANSPWKTMEDLIEDAKKRPGEITFAVTGAEGGSNHLSHLIWTNATGVNVKVVNIPGGEAPLVEAILTGEVMASTGTIAGFMPQLKSGNMNLLAVMAEERYELFPDVPTFKEIGYDAVSESFRAIAVPKGTNKQIITILEEAFRKGFNDPDFQKWIITVGGGAVWKNAEETKKYVKKIQTDAMALIKKFGL